MSTPFSKRIIPAGGLLLLLLAIAALAMRFLGTDTEKEAREAVPAPVAVTPLARGAIELRRTFSGSVEARANFAVSPKVSGRIEALHLDIGDTVERGQVVAELDNAEYVQAVAQAEADMAVGQANLAEAKSALEIAERELARIETLRERGIASESQLDEASVEQLGARARLEVAQAERTRAISSLETANIRLGYTQVRAEWSEGDDDRVVAERFVDAGQTVSANDPLVQVVEITPVTGVFFVTENEYGRLAPGQEVRLTTDAYREKHFTGSIRRIAPVFQQSTRQARVEVEIENSDRLLKPGMFIRATVRLDRAEDALVVPVTAITRRADETGIFLVDESGETVRWHPVTIGIREGDRIQLIDPPFDVGRVVTLGQHLIDDGSPIVIPEDPAEAGVTPATAEP